MPELKSSEKTIARGDPDVGFGLAVGGAELLTDVGESPFFAGGAASAMAEISVDAIQSESSRAPSIAERALRGEKNMGSSRVVWNVVMQVARRM